MQRQELQAIPDVSKRRRYTPSEAIEVEKELWIKLVDSYLRNYPRSLSIARKKKIRRTLLRFAKEIKKHPDQITRQDLENFFESRKKIGLKDWTVNNYKIILKQFYRKRKGRRFVEWIHIPKNMKPTVGPEDILSEEEFSLMMAACEDLRDKAIISSLFETDFRPGEFISLKVRNVSFDQYGARMHIEQGKTGPRTVRVINCATYLANWIENHPLRGEKDAPLWLSYSHSRKHRGINDVGLRKIVKRIAGGAHISKRIWPYLFRHSRNTQLAPFLTEGPLCEYAGWQIGSRMPSYYVHLSGKNVDDAVLRMHGIIKEDGPKKLPLKCTRCGSMAAPEQDTCHKCGMPLSLKAAMRADETERQLAEKVKRLEVSEEKRDRDLRELKDMLEKALGNT